MAQASTTELGTATSFAVGVPCNPLEEVLAQGFGWLGQEGDVSC